MAPASSDCTPDASFIPPTEYPHSIYSRKVLDRRDYLVPTRVPTYINGAGVPEPWPVLDGFVKKQALPSITLNTSPGVMSEPAALTVYNTPRLIATVPVAQYLTTGISAVTARDGFSVQHNCATLEGGQTCALLVRFTGETAMAQKVGSLRIDFTTGEFAVISLLGLTRPN